MDPVSGEEASFQRALLEAINATNGLLVWRQQAGQVKRGKGYIRLAPKGACDLVGIAAPSGRLVSVEVKAGKVRDNGQGTLEAQRLWAAGIRTAGGIHVSATKGDGETIEAACARVVREIQEAARCGS